MQRLYSELLPDGRASVGALSVTTQSLWPWVGTNIWLADRELCLSAQLPANRSSCWSAPVFPHSWTPIFLNPSTSRSAGSPPPLCLFPAEKPLPQHPTPLAPPAGAEPTGRGSHVTSDSYWPFLLSLSNIITQKRICESRWPLPLTFFIQPSSPRSI